MKDDITLKFLYLVSRHLSSRPECSGIEYSVTVDEYKRVYVEPYVEVYPNRYNRLPGQKESLVRHIFKHHIDYFDFVMYAVPGTYVYKLSATSKRRKWTNVKLFEIVIDNKKMDEED